MSLLCLQSCFEQNVVCRNCELFNVLSKLKLDHELYIALVLILALKCQCFWIELKHFLELHNYVLVMFTQLFWYGLRMADGGLLKF